MPFQKGQPRPPHARERVLSWRQVLEIRWLTWCVPDITQSAIARYYETHPPKINNIAKGNAYLLPRDPGPITTWAFLGLTTTNRAEIIRQQVAAFQSGTTANEREALVAAIVERERQVWQRRGRPGLALNAIGRVPVVVPDMISALLAAGRPLPPFGPVPGDYLPGASQ